MIDEYVFDVVCCEVEGGVWCDGICWWLYVEEFWIKIEGMVWVVEVECWIGDEIWIDVWEEVVVFVFEDV